jgi:hypothetical protein
MGDLIPTLEPECYLKSAKEFGFRRSSMGEQSPELLAPIEYSNRNVFFQRVFRLSGLRWRGVCHAAQN